MHNIKMSDILGGYGKRIRALRNHRNLTQEQLAEMIGVGQSQIANIETGRVAPPSLAHAAAIARALGVSVDELLGIEGDVENSLVMPNKRAVDAKLKTLLRELPLARHVEILALVEAMHKAEEYERLRSTGAMLSLIDQLADGEAKEILMQANRLQDLGDTRGASDLIEKFFGWGDADQPEDEELE